MKRPDEQLTNDFDRVSAPSETIRTIEVPEDEPHPDLFRDLLCAQLETLAPQLAAVIRDRTAEAKDYRDVLAIASRVVVEEEDGKDLNDLLNIDQFLGQFGIETAAGSEHLPEVTPDAPQTVSEVVEQVREGAFRRQLYLASEGIMDSKQRELLLTTHPTEEPFELGLYNIAIIWIAQYLMQQDPMTPPTGSKAAVKRQLKDREEQMQAHAAHLLADRGILSPLDAA